MSKNTLIYRELTGLMKRILEMTMRAANLAVSDHRPVWAVFRIDLDDDGTDEDGSVSLKPADIHDVNGDGLINVLDLVAVANGFGKTEPDVNGDGVVNILDLVIIAGEFGR